MEVKTTPKLPQREVKYSINEIFGPTIQGEGLLIGCPTHFVRFNGCDYRCSWCDSLPAVLPELIRLPGNNTLMSADDIVQKLKQLPRAGMVTLSGGNPALIKTLKPLILLLQESRFKVAVETQGSIYQEWFHDLDYMVLSPKPPSAHIQFDADMFDRILCNFDSAFRQTDISIKVVIFTDEDIEFAAHIHYEYPDMPFFVQCGTPQQHPSLEEMRDQYKDLIEKLLVDPRFADTRILPQLHAYVWGHKRGI